MLIQPHARRLSSLGCALTVLAVALLWSASPSSAEDDAEAGRMVLVMDSSGSMKEKVSGGETKIAAAETALDDVIGSLPDDQQVGLRVYGAKVFSRNDKGACTDSQLVVPVETDNRGDLGSAVKSYKPYGETPIGYALQQAGRDLGSEGKRSIVLVSDGEPTCAPDPCKVARQLGKQGIDLRIDVVGLDVGGSARSKLACIAKAGHGVYYDASSSSELSESLQTLATRAARPFTTVGTPVAATTDPASAPTITAGDWSDTLPASSGSEHTQYYRVERKIPGSTLHVSASRRTTSTGVTFLKLSAKTHDGQECGYAGTVDQIMVGELSAVSVLVDDLAAPDRADPDAPCIAADSLLVAVHDRANAGDPERPVELRVIEEPPVTNLDLLQQSPQTPRWIGPPAGKPSAKVVPGTSFLDAPLLDQGVYSGTIVPGEVQTYQVDLDWGQQLAADVRVPKLGQRVADAFSGGVNSNLFDLKLYAPDRALASVSSPSGGPSAKTFIGLAAPTEIGATTHTVNYTNRASTTAAERGSALAGRYTVTVSLEKNPGDKSVIIPFTLRLGVSGSQAIAPVYAEEPADPDAAEQAPTATDDPTDIPVSDDGNTVVVVLVVAAGLLAIAAAGCLTLRMTRRNR